ncbi:MAG: hypothetical protein HQM12_19525 [SAR324 cluster bacterium]|nr:hypothetical protein [SAR324 cluster bacterium]
MAVQGIQSMKKQIQTHSGNRMIIYLEFLKTNRAYGIGVIGTGILSLIFCLKVLFSFAELGLMQIPIGLLGGLAIFASGVVYTLCAMQWKKYFEFNLQTTLPLKQEILLRLCNRLANTFIWGHLIGIVLVGIGFIVSETFEVMLTIVLIGITSVSLLGIEWILIPRITLNMKLWMREKPFHFSTFVGACVFTACIIGFSVASYTAPQTLGRAIILTLIAVCIALYFEMEERGGNSFIEEIKKFFNK